jgi:heterogeneous nuclear rnp K-like protein 2
VSTEDADVIAGKDGEGVANLREQTGVKVDVSENLPGVHERVISISGSVESVAEVCSHN